MKPKVTVIVCRPEQTLETAIAVSCIGGNARLAVLTEPPISEEEYRRRHEIFRVAMDARDNRIRGPIGRAEVFTGLEKFDVAKANQEVDEAARALTTFREWRKHNASISRLAAKWDIERLLYLCEPAFEELNLIEPVPLGKIKEDRVPVFASHISSLFVLPGASECPAEPEAEGEVKRIFYSSTKELTHAVWNAIRGSALTDPIPVTSSDICSVFEGLYRSLKCGQALQVSEINQKAGFIDFDDSTDSEEAVVIEAANEAGRLLGVIYALSQKCRLIVYAQPDIKPVQDALRESEENASTKRAAISYVAAHRKKALSSLKIPDEAKEVIKLLPDQVSSEQETRFEEKRFWDCLRKILAPEVDPFLLTEHAVTSTVPSEVVEAVGERRLTAVTSGIPYQFIKTATTDWSLKPIGHIAGDISLLFSMAMSSDLKDPSEIGLNLLFDPGQFDTRETKYVLSELKPNRSRTLLLQQAAASSIALIHLTKELPVDLVYFNTHGGDDVIVLADAALPAFKLAQRVSLTSSPLVFNNSCLSWVGVGRQFVQIGARGYLGTLWSVDAALAADYAQTVLRNLVQSNLPVSQAMRRFEGNNASKLQQFSKAYIFVGTTKTRLNPRETGPLSSDLDRKLADLRLLKATLLRYPLQAAGAHEEINLSIVKSVYDPLAALSDEVRASDVGPIGDLWEISIGEIEILFNLIDKLPGVPARLEKLLELTEKYLANFREATADAKGASFHDWRGKIMERMGNLDKARKDYELSIELSQRLRIEPVDQLLGLAGLDRARGDGESARARIDQVRQWLETRLKEEQDPDIKPQCERKLALALGDLCQLYRRANDLETAQRFASQGALLAEKLGNWSQQSMFLMDQSRILYQQGYTAMAKEIGEYVSAAAAKSGIKQQLTFEMPPIDFGQEPFLEAFRKAEESLYLARRADDPSLEEMAYGLLVNYLMAAGQLELAARKAALAYQVCKQRGSVKGAADFQVDLATNYLRTGKADQAFANFRGASLAFSRIQEFDRLRETLKRAEAFALKEKSWEARQQMIELAYGLIDTVPTALWQMLARSTLTGIEQMARIHGTVSTKIELNKLNKSLGKIPVRQPMSDRRTSYRSLIKFAAQRAGTPGMTCDQLKSELDPLLEGLPG